MAGGERTTSSSLQLLYQVTAGPRHHRPSPRHHRPSPRNHRPPRQRPLAIAATGHRRHRRHRYRRPTVTAATAATAATFTAATAATAATFTAATAATFTAAAASPTSPGEVLARSLPLPLTLPLTCTRWSSACGA